MNSNALKYYQSVVCLKQLEDTSDLCCQEKGHGGDCDSTPRLHLLDPLRFEKRFTIEATLMGFLCFVKDYLRESSCPSKEHVLAAVAFDFTCYAYSVEECKKHMIWDEEFDNLRKTMFAHASHINYELKKIHISLCDYNKYLQCPVLGKKYTISLFNESLLCDKDTFLKSNTLLSPDSLSYTGPYIVPITQRGLQFVGDYPLIHDCQTTNNWRHELNSVVEFQHSI